MNRVLSNALGVLLGTALACPLGWFALTAQVTPPPLPPSVTAAVKTAADPARPQSSSPDSTHVIAWDTEPGQPEPPPSRESPASAAVGSFTLPPLPPPASPQPENSSPPATAAPTLIIPVLANGPTVPTPATIPDGPAKKEETSPASSSLPATAESISLPSSAAHSSPPPQKPDLPSAEVVPPRENLAPVTQPTPQPNWTTPDQRAVPSLPQPVKVLPIPPSAHAQPPSDHPVRAAPPVEQPRATVPTLPKPPRTVPVVEDQPAPGKGQALIELPLSGTVDVYLNGKELETDKPFLSQVTLLGVQEVHGKRFLAFRDARHPEERCLLDPKEIVALRWRRKAEETYPVRH